MKKFKTSYSQNNTYIQCPEHWKKSYVERWKPDVDGASLYFGSAIDHAVEQMLKGEKHWLNSFYDRWNKAWSFGNTTQVFDNDKIIYGYKDFDEHILDDVDFTILATWASELNFNESSKEDIIKLYKQIVKNKKNPYKNLKSAELKFFNRASWLSMKKKGKLMLEAFEREFLPKVKRVIDVQKRADLVGSNGDTIIGFIDMILEIEGYDKPIIFDLKTASRPYTQENIDFSDQLTLYCAMKGQEYNTDLVGYVVLPKNMVKHRINTCKNCGNRKNSRHLTCNVLKLDNTRCNGEWEESIKCEAEVQIMVQRKSQEQITNFLDGISNIILAMKNGITYKNTNKCTNWYGSICPYYNACHNNDYSDLIKK